MDVTDEGRLAAAQKAATNIIDFTQQTRDSDVRVKDTDKGPVLEFVGHDGKVKLSKENANVIIVKYFLQRLHADLPLIDDALTELAKEIKQPHPNKPGEPKFVSKDELDIYRAIYQECIKAGVPKR